MVDSSSTSLDCASSSEISLVEATADLEAIATSVFLFILVGENLGVCLEGIAVGMCSSSDSSEITLLFLTAGSDVFGASHISVILASGIYAYPQGGFVLDRRLYQLPGLALYLKQHTHFDVFMLFRRFWRLRRLITRRYRKELAIKSISAHLK
jgi:hypothetical protein